MLFLVSLAAISRALPSLKDPDNAQGIRILMPFSSLVQRFTFPHSELRNIYVADDGKTYHLDADFLLPPILIWFD